MLGRLPAAEQLFKDRGYDADWFREKQVIRLCIPRRQVRGKAVAHQKMTLSTLQPNRYTLRHALCDLPVRNRHRCYRLLLTLTINGAETQMLPCEDILPERIWLEPVAILS